MEHLPWPWSRCQIGERILEQKRSKFEFEFAISEANARRIPNAPITINSHDNGRSVDNHVTEIYQSEAIHCNKPIGSTDTLIA